MVLLGISLVPCAAIAWWLFRSDRHREPPKFILVTVLLGAAAALPIIAVEFGMQAVLGLPDELATIGQAVAVSFLVAALVEEAFKFAVLRWYAMRRSAFDEPYDGVVYGAAASLGFAALENALYVFGGETTGDGLAIGVMRALTAVPMHATCGIVMGACLGVAHFTPGSRVLWYCLGLGGAIGLHGAYDSFAFGSMVMASQEQFEWAVVSMGGLLSTLALGVLVALLAVARMRRDQLRALMALGAGVSGEPALQPADAALFAPIVATPATARPPVLPMVSLVLVALATASVVLFFTLAILMGDAEDPGTALAACGLIGGCAVLAFAGSVTAVVGLARRERWMAASIVSLVAGLAMLGLIALTVVAGAWAP